MKPVYERIYTAVREIPPGHVATYGGIARHVGASTPRQVGYAMAALPAGSDVPWHRVINFRGEVSTRTSGYGASEQRTLLEEEGVYFDRRGRVDLTKFGWLS
ncbi:MAG TPA: MGMT family protein [Gammaproteobacteria bacterium]|nr:MGMT family protein [Gammaproteobacteria bacterium]